MTTQASTKQRASLLPLFELNRWGVCSSWGLQIVCSVRHQCGRGGGFAPHQVDAVITAAAAAAAAAAAVLLLLCRKPWVSENHTDASCCCSSHSDTDVQLQWCCCGIHAVTGSQNTFRSTCIMHVPPAALPLAAADSIAQHSMAAQCRLQRCV
jgi:hypothetical protein